MERVTRIVQKECLANVTYFDAEYSQEKCHFHRPVLTGSIEERQVACFYPLGGVKK